MGFGRLSLSWDRASKLKIGSEFRVLKVGRTIRIGKGRGVCEGEKRIRGVLFAWGLWLCSHLGVFVFFKRTKIYLSIYAVSSFSASCHRIK